MSNHFNELLLQTLKEVGIRLERLEGRVDHVINEKADKSDLKEVKADVKAVIEKLDQKADKSSVEDVKSSVEDVKSDLKALRDEVRFNGTRLDRIETGIKTLRWMMTASIAVMGIILAFMKAC